MNRSSYPPPADTVAFEAEFFGHVWTWKDMDFLRESRVEIQEFAPVGRWPDTTFRLSWTWGSERRRFQERVWFEDGSPSSRRDALAEGILWRAGPPG